MYSSARKTLDIASLAAAAIVFAVLVPPLTAELPAVAVAITAGVLFTGLFSLSGLVRRRGDSFLRTGAFRRGDTRILGAFVDVSASRPTTSSAHAASCWSSPPTVPSS